MNYRKIIQSRNPILIKQWNQTNTSFKYYDKYNKILDVWVTTYNSHPFDIDKITLYACILNMCIYQPSKIDNGYIDDIITLGDIAICKFLYRRGYTLDVSGSLCTSTIGHIHHHIYIIKNDVMCEVDFNNIICSNNDILWLKYLHRDTQTISGNLCDTDI
jgi:hypothetical protein